MYYMQINKNLCIKLEINQGYTTMHGQSIIKIIPLCSESRTKHINVFYRQNVNFWSSKLVVHKVSTGPCRVTVKLSQFLLLYVDRVAQSV